MMFKAKELGMIKGIGFHNNVIHLTHLQFVDDTVLFRDPCMEYLLNVKRISRCFELALDLKINFHKSCLIKVGKRGPRDGIWATAFRCVSSSFPLTYLGLPLGEFASREAFWNPIITKVEQRLAPWKRGLISKGGRLVYIKAVLSSLPTYFMSMFRITRFGREQSSLWKSIICAKYGLDHDSLIWEFSDVKGCSNLLKVNSLFKEGTKSFDIINTGFQVVVRKGDSVRLWKDLRWDSIPLRQAFPRIFSIASNKFGTLKEYGSWVDSSWVWDVGLRRQLFGWERDQWNVFLLSLQGESVRREIPDALAWSYCPNGSFSFKSFRRCLENAIGLGSGICQFHARSSNSLADCLAKADSGLHRKRL
ncbi:hypothetical protein Dsin_009335 [Dipteronia sinensis]|uniref:Reverse transcriptase domain-containing protein n=1 Tax=Dipteronia sinensis TaxID=43782 RepID=A0AAE0EDE0_9ROSI|nr:hypothetical protein Dsin_009335 [Dipteronia sinensis]